MDSPLITSMGFRLWLSRPANDKETRSSKVATDKMRPTFPSARPLSPKGPQKPSNTLVFLGLASNNVSALQVF